MAVPKKKHTRSRSNKRRNAQKSKRANTMLERARSAMNRSSKNE